METHHYEGKHFEVPQLIAEGYSFRPDPNEFRDLICGKRLDSLQENAIQTLGMPWNERHFQTPRRPIIMDRLCTACRRTFSDWSTPVRRILDMPIKLISARYPAPDSEYHIPQQLEQFGHVIKQIANLDASLEDRSGGNYVAAHYYCYLTLEQSRVPAGNTQRQPGWHVDGFQGARVVEKLPGDHSYVVVNDLPPLFVSGPFRTEHLNPARDDYYQEMAKQAEGMKIWRPKPHEIIYMDAYTAHRAVIAKRSVFRTFLRMTYSVRQFDRLGNTHNPLLSYDWPMVKRNAFASSNPGE